MKNLDVYIFLAISLAVFSIAIYEILGWNLTGLVFISLGWFLILTTAIIIALFGSKNSSRKQQIIEPTYEKCFDCGQKLHPNIEQVELTKSISDGNQKQIKLCKDCIVKELDKQDGVCPQCNKPLKWNGNLREFFGEWYHPKCAFEVQQGKHTKEVSTQEVVVKVRCQYCKYPYDESLDKCPQCGGKRV
jgi:ssDNA-binding Zn-finger/Zn-ribbon topoisomerase 1